MNEGQIIKIRRFLGDTEMQSTIKSVLYASFLKKRENNVYLLAAQTLAVQCLEEAWRELERYRVEIKQKDNSKNIGV